VSRTVWRQQTLDIIHNFKHSRSDPILKQIMLEGLRNFHDHKAGIQEETYDQEYTALIRQQNALGWDQLYRGRWSKQWSRLHTKYARQQHGWTMGEKEGDNWVIGHGHLLLEQWLKLWQTRNEERHGADLETRQRHRQTVITTQLQEIYKLRTKVIPRDRHLFYSSPEEHLATRPNLDLIEDWILTHRNAIQASAAQAAQNGITGTRTIEEYFRNTRHQVNDREILAAGDEEAP
jgi:hypothetical protein